MQTLLRPRLVGDGADPAAERGGHVVAICGAQGGAGATSIAVNLAIELADTAKATVALLDLHLQDGEAAVMLGVRPGRGCASRWRIRCAPTRCSWSAPRSRWSRGCG